ncbi:MAG TPA: hypothetical protein DEH78_16715 [Solibacterales bacterium]|nr:hypothetical protein [Bryobacterales bacterium]
MERLLTQLVERLRKAQGERLVSVVLYGSAAVGDHQGRYSDINILCVVDAVDARGLAASEGVFHWWRELGNPAPLLLSESEVRASTDCFPIEFHDIRERHRILHGKDVVGGLEVDDSFYRAQVEHELRAKLLRLRQKAAGVLQDAGLLTQLMADSVSTFCVLARHALRLHGAPAPHLKRDVVAQARESLGLDGSAFLTLLDVREERLKARDLKPAALFEKYLGEIQVLVDAVDRLEK